MSVNMFIIVIRFNAKNVRQIKRNLEFTFISDASEKKFNALTFKSRVVTPENGNEHSKSKQREQFVFTTLRL
jgi:hypothetical protein